MNRQRLAARESEMLSEIGREMGWDIHYDQLEPGRFAGVVECAGTAAAQFFHERYNRSLCIHGAVPAGMATFLLPARRTETVTFRGNAVKPGTLCALTPGDEGAFCTPAGYGFLNCCFTAERLDRALLALSHTTLARVLPQTTTVPVPTSAMARLHAATQAAFARPPDPDEVLDPAVADRTIEERVLAALCAALTVGDPPMPAPLAERNHWRCVRAVRDYAEAHLGKALGIEVLCRVSGVSERTLDTAFRKVVGLSPQQFMKARRLNAAHHALSGAHPAETSVKAIALDCGFWHHGYFARDYKALFGESPSATLARR